MTIVAGERAVSRVWLSAAGALWRPACRRRAGLASCYWDECPARGACCAVLRQLRSIFPDLESLCLQYSCHHQSVYIPLCIVPRLVLFFLDFLVEPFSGDSAKNSKDSERTIWKLFLVIRLGLVWLDFINGSLFALLNWISFELKRSLFFESSARMELLQKALFNLPRAGANTNSNQGDISRSGKEFWLLSKYVCSDGKVWCF